MTGTRPATARPSAVPDRHLRLLRLAASLEAAGASLRRQATAPGLLDRARELEADAIAVRAGVRRLQRTAELVGSARDMLEPMLWGVDRYPEPATAPRGAVVAAGLVETDVMDRDEVGAYLDELAAADPTLMHHFATGGGGLLDRLPLRASLSVGHPGRGLVTPARRPGVGEPDAEAAQRLGTALIDAAAGFGVTSGDGSPAPGSAPLRLAVETSPAPAGLGSLVEQLVAARRVRVLRVAPARYLVLLPAAYARDLGTDDPVPVTSAPACEAAAIGRAVHAVVEPGAAVLLAGAAGSAEVALALAAQSLLRVEQVVVVAGSAAAERNPVGVPVLAVRDGLDPLGRLGVEGMTDPATEQANVLVDAGATWREACVTGAHAADGSRHLEVRSQLDRLRSRGFLGSASAARM